MATTNGSALNAKWIHWTLTTFATLFITLMGFVINKNIDQDDKLIKLQAEVAIIKHYFEARQ